MADLTVPIDITAINNTANEQQPQIKRLIMTTIRKVLANFTKYPGDVRSSKPLVTFVDGSTMQPYDPNLANAKQLGILSKREISVDVGMSFVKDEVERYRDTYLGLTEDLALKEKAKLPFASWYLQTITKVGLKDLFKLPYQGVKAAGTNAVDITDGYLKIIADEVIGGGIAVGNGNLYELSGAATDYTAANIGAELKAQFALFPEERQEEGCEIHIPYRYRRMYKEWFKSEYPNITDGDVPTDYLDGEDKKAKFVWTSAMGTSKRVIMTTKSNLVYGVDKSSGEFGKILVFYFNNNPYILAATNKSVIGFQIRTLHKSEFNVNNLA